MISSKLKLNYDSDNKIWSGPQRTKIYHPDVSIGEIFLTTFARDPEKIVQINYSTDRSFTSREMRLSSIKVAKHLKWLGYKQNKDVIGIISKNVDYLFPVIYGCFISGIPFNTLDPLFTKDEIIHMFGKTKPSIIFCDKSSYETLLSALAELKSRSPVYVLDDDRGNMGNLEPFFKSTDSDFFLTNHYTAPVLEKGGDQTAAILCSSGTTAPCKGVCISHRALTLGTNAKFITRDDVCISFSTLYWFSGLLYVIYSAFTACCRIITIEEFSPITALNIWQKYRVTFVIMPPAHAAILIQHHAIGTYDLDRIKCVLLVGSMLPKKVASKLQEYIREGSVVTGYAMTETACNGTGTMCLLKPGSVGQPIGGVQVKIVDEISAKSVGPNEEGEIYIRTDFKWNGYYDDAEETEKIYDSDRWIHSGDLGYMDNEGFLYMVGRKKEIFKYKSYHIYPGELENIINDMPGVSGACVCGLFDETTATEYPAAAVITQNNSNLSAKDIQDYVASKVTDYKRLRGGVYFVDKFPMTSSGKVKKAKVMELLVKFKTCKI